MDLSTTYLGFELPHPFITGASPLTDNMDTVRKLEDAGAAALVMRSLFEEQLVSEQLATDRAMSEPAESFAEALTYFPDTDNFVLGPQEYLAQISKIKEAVDVPVIASLNGTTPGGWLEYAKQMEQAGADALELNVYYLPTDPQEDGQAIEKRTVEMVSDVKKAVNIPVAVKLSPYYSSCANMAQQLEQAGADGLVLFNRFYQSDIDTEELEVVSSLTLSNSGALLLRLRWLAILSGRIRPQLAVTGGVHSAADAIKSVMCGAHAVQMVSALLENGTDTLKSVREEMSNWMEEREYDSLRQMQGSMNLTKCPNPRAFERANYMHILQSWQEA
jgi:dihydroorotate dehydrogenase (fumarate)